VLTMQRQSGMINKSYPLRTHTSLLSVTACFLLLIKHLKGGHALKVIHPICAGIDIHKKSSTVALNETKANSTYSVLNKTLPGIKETAAVAIIAEIGVDMSAIYSDKHLRLGLGYRPKTVRVPARKKVPLPNQAMDTSHPCLYNVPMLQPRKPEHG